MNEANTNAFCECPTFCCFRGQCESEILRFLNLVAYGLPLRSPNAVL